MSVVPDMMDHMPSELVGRDAELEQLCSTLGISLGDAASTTDRSAPLEMDSATFRRLGHALIDQLADALAKVPDGPVTRSEAR